MSKLDALTTVSEDDAPIITIFGEGGLGKTSLGALFPSPIFITAENGLKSIPKAQRPKSFPLVETSAQLWEYLTLLMTQTHSYQTLVIDTITSLDMVFRKEIMEKSSAASMSKAAGGYGGGYDLLLSEHAKCRKFCERLRSQLGMSVVFLSHAVMSKIDPPDTEAYSKYSIPLHEKSRHPYVNDVDLVGFIQLRKLIRGQDGAMKKATSFGERELVCHSVASNDSKNRYGITEPLEYVDGQNPLLSQIQFYRDNFPELAV